MGRDEEAVKRTTVCPRCKIKPKERFGYCKGCLREKKRAQGQMFKVGRRVGFKRGAAAKGAFRISEKEMETLTHNNIAASLDSQFAGSTPNGSWRVNKCDPFFRLHPDDNWDFSDLNEI